MGKEEGKSELRLRASKFQRHKINMKVTTECASIGVEELASSVCGTS